MVPLSLGTEVIHRWKTARLAHRRLLIREIWWAVTRKPGRGKYALFLLTEPQLCIANCVPCYAFRRRVRQPGGTRMPPFKSSRHIPVKNLYFSPCCYVIVLISRRTNIYLDSECRRESPLLRTWDSAGRRLRNTVGPSVTRRKL